MTRSQHESACEQPAATEPIPLGVEPQRRPAPDPEGPPDHGAARGGADQLRVPGHVHLTMFPLLTEYLDDGGGMGPLLLPTLSDSVLLEKSCPEPPS